MNTLPYLEIETEDSLCQTESILKMEHIFNRSAVFCPLCREEHKISGIQDNTLLRDLDESQEPLRKKRKIENLYLSYIPNEIWVHVFSFLQLKEVTTIA